MSRIPRADHRAALEASVTEMLGSRREARWVLEDALGGADAPVTEEGAATAMGLAQRRGRGEPLQYVLGHWPFRHLDLLVDARALIPRPETEWLADVALAEFDRLVSSGAPPRVVDLGTGTGALALSIASERAAHGVQVIATDVDPDTVDLARTNAARAGLVPSAVRFRVGDWWQALDDDDRGRVALVVANPPYVSALEWELLDPLVRDHEPHGALIAGPGSDGTPGFAALETILGGASSWVSRPGAVVAELAPHQAQSALACARRTASSAAVLHDLAGRPRAVVARFG